MSRILFTGEGGDLGRYPLADTPTSQVHPLSRYTPGQVPLGRYTTPWAGKPPPGRYTTPSRYTPLGRYTPLAGYTPPGQVHPPEQVHTPTGRYTPPDRYTPPPWAMSGQYASYWNAFLFMQFWKKMLPNNRLAHLLWGILDPPLFAIVKAQKAVRLPCNSRNFDVLMEFSQNCSCLFFCNVHHILRSDV